MIVNMIQSYTAKNVNMARVEKTPQPNVTKRNIMSYSDEMRKCLAIGGHFDGDLLEGHGRDIIKAPVFEPVAYMMSSDKLPDELSETKYETYRYAEWSVKEGENVGLWIHDSLSTTQAFYKLLFRYTNNHPAVFEKAYGDKISPKLFY